MPYFFGPWYNSRYRKNLKRFYIVHPSLFTRSLLPFILPLLSPKSYSKLHPLPSLLALYYTHDVPLTGIDLSLAVLESEGRALRDHPELLECGPELLDVQRISSRDSNKSKYGKEGSDSYLSSISSTFSSAASYIGLSRLPSPTHSASSSRVGEAVVDGYWKRDLRGLVDECGGKVPPMVVRSPYMAPLQSLLALPLEAQPNLPWSALAQKDKLLLPKVLCKFLSELAGPVIGWEVYGDVRRVALPSDIPQFLNKLPPSHTLLLTAVVSLLHALAKHEPTTKMSALNLAIVLAPTLIGGPDKVVDMGMCLERGKKLPLGMRERVEGRGRDGEGGGEREGGGEEGEGDGTVVGLLEIWITNYPSISGETPIEKMECGVSSEFVPPPTSARASQAASSSSPFPTLASTFTSSSSHPSSSTEPASSSSSSSSQTQTKTQRRASLSPSPSPPKSSPPRASSLARSASASIRRASLSLGRRGGDKVRDKDRVDLEKEKEKEKEKGGRGERRRSGVRHSLLASGIVEVPSASS
ncbi:hypothetical protein I350_07924 [Cryptococcus amylolentus CBS 6273]|uniref:Rho-GAP domain-containing protein n=1 Tax=Cryptococcus amylolentus CBS 6273 TaxID=1296118 RepID=A0A1E3J7V9_9TREE|nr:hypothetical protein I350_07924 [Cryptococcus amylolentus CBS 6273]